MAAKKEEKKRKEKRSRGLIVDAVRPITDRPLHVGERYYSKFEYHNCKSDYSGWVDANDYLPIPFDLMYLKVIDHETKLNLTKYGWWNGHGWDGEKIEKEDKVLYWKRCLEKVE